MISPQGRLARTARWPDSNSPPRDRLRVPDHPEADRVHVDRDGVLRQGRFRAEVRGADAHVHRLHDALDDRDDEERARSLEPVESAQAKDHRTVPLVGDLQGEQNVDRQEDGHARHGRMDLIPLPHDVAVDDEPGGQNENRGQERGQVQLRAGHFETFHVLARNRHRFWGLTSESHGLASLAGTRRFL